MKHNDDVVIISEKLAGYSSSRKKRIFRKVTQAALGSIPWVGGVISAIASFREGEEQAATDSLQKEWLEEHGRKIQELISTLTSIIERLDSFGEEVKDRMESEDYLSIVRRGFKEWDDASTDQKKKLIVQLMTNAGLSRLCSDDVIRLFQDWISHYHEIHFAVIATIYNNSGWSRNKIWQKIRGAIPRENSAEADLFKLLIRDLSTGGIIRQHRETNLNGEFVKAQKKPSSRSTTLKSAFDDQETYELTELGRQFVHYTMEEVVLRVTQ
jgi:hypothetical protein